MMFASMNILLAYVGPETILPFTTVIAAISGFVMLFWNTLRVTALRILRRTPREETEECADEASSSHA